MCKLGHAIISPDGDVCGHKKKWALEWIEDKFGSKLVEESVLQ